jgi:hypothetical protein
LTSLEDLHFEKPLTQAIDDLIAKLGELIDSFNHVGDAAVSGFGRARGSAEAVGTAVPRPSYASGTHGRYINFGAGTAVTLHGNERVMTEGEALGLGGGDIYVSIGNQAIDPYLVSVARKDAARGGLKPRVTSGRSY